MEKCLHETVVKVYAASKTIPNRKELVVRCENCDEENHDFLKTAKKIIDLTPDDL